MRRLLVAVLVLAACGGDSSRGPIADPAVFLHDLPVVECGHLAECGVYSSVDDCLAARPQRALVSGVPYSRWQHDPRIVAAVERGTVTYSPTSAGECIDAIRARTCSDLRDPADRVCDRVLVGTVPDGSVPAYPFECVSGWQDQYECDVRAACCGGPCVIGPTTRRDLGQSCDPDGTRCRDGLRCAEGVCIEGSGEGGPCRLSSECADDLTCDDGQCTAERPEPPGYCRISSVEYVGCPTGEACGTDDRCHPYRHAGESCNDTTEWCDLGSYCDRDRGRCVGIADEGEECFRESSGPYCATGLYCDASRADEPYRCQRPLGDGSACRLDMGCQSGYCDPVDRRCAPLPTCP